MNAKFDVDPEFNMMNEMSSDMQNKNYYAPKKFVVENGTEPALNVTDE